MSRKCANKIINEIDQIMSYLRQLKKVWSHAYRDTFSSNHNVHKSSCGLYFWAPDLWIYRFAYNLLIKGSKAQKLKTSIWMWGFDKKVYLLLSTCISMTGCKDYNGFI